MPEEKLGSLVITEEDRVFEKEFPKRGKFRVRIPRPFERIHVNATMAKLLGGGSADALSPLDREYMVRVLMLDLILTGPEGWPGANNCSDEELLEALWLWYLECETLFRRRLREGSFSKVAPPEKQAPIPPVKGTAEQPRPTRRVAPDNRGDTD